MHIEKSGLYKAAFSISYMTGLLFIAAAEKNRFADFL